MIFASSSLVVDQICPDYFTLVNFPMSALIKMKNELFDSWKLIFLAVLPT